MSSFDLKNSFKFIEHAKVSEELSDISQQTIIDSVSEQFRLQESKKSGLNMTDLTGYFPGIE